MPTNTTQPATPAVLDALDASDEPLTDQPPSRVEQEHRRLESVRLAAYAAYERRGCAPGHDIEDWLQAEAEVALRLPSSQPDPSLLKERSEASSRAPEAKKTEAERPSRFDAGSTAA